MAKNWDSSAPLEGTILSFIEVAKKWNVEVFGNLLQKKQILLARIRGIQ